jgi:hypothetical protein
MWDRDNPIKNNETNHEAQGPIAYYRTIKLKKQLFFKKDLKNTELKPG